MKSEAFLSNFALLDSVVKDLPEMNSVSHFEPLHGKSGYSEDPQNALLYFSKAYNFLRHRDDTAFIAHNSQFSY